MQIKKTNRCRVCGSGFFKEPLLQFENMPKAAQFLPDKKSLKKDMGIDLDVFQCSGCGLVQLNSSPVPYYREVVRAVGISPETKKFRKEQFKKFIKRNYLKNKKMIEIGCGGGEYLSILKQCGVEAYGLEYSLKSVKKCLEQGLKAEKGFIGSGNLKLKNAPFDAFLILNFLEHLPDLNTVLSSINNNLGKGAVGLVEVPNFNMILKRKLFSEFVSDHLFYFTKDTLSTVLKLNGFEIIECHEIRDSYIISAVVKKRSRIDASHFNCRKARLKNEVWKYIRRFKKVAVWGAGHQALANISLLNLTGKIRYVIDSAPFKQGKYTPATHIPIVSPKEFYKDPVEAIIVITGSYSDEVARIIRKNYGKDIGVAILRDFGLEII